MPSEEDRATATGNMYIKFGEIWTCGFWDRPMQADRPTNSHAEPNTSHFYRKRNKYSGDFGWLGSLNVNDTQLYGILYSVFTESVYMAGTIFEIQRVICV